MQSPLIRFLVSSPYGDVPVDTDRLDLPLECDPLKTSYRAYFQSIRNFLEEGKCRRILEAMAERNGHEYNLKDVKEIIVRTEKHGALYHPASVELILNGSKMKFGLNVAVSETGREWLKREFDVISRINSKFALSYLPAVYSFDENGSASFLLEEWFEGYHEFHLTLREDGKHCVKLWEYGKGNRYLSDEESFQVYRQISKILTLYYDINDFSQIFPWHHAAGDFILSMEDDGIDVRLTTARQYEPYMVFQEKEGLNPVLALVFFFLNLTIKMRLDKLDGVGDTVWAEDSCLDATVKGFYEALRTKDALKADFDSGEGFFDLLKSFGTEDLNAACQPLIDLYSGSADHAVIIANLDRHVSVLRTTLQNFPL